MNKVILFELIHGDLSNGFYEDKDRENILSTKASKIAHKRQDTWWGRTHGGRCLWEGCGWKLGLVCLSWNNVSKGLENHDKDFGFDIAGRGSQTQLYREARKVT